MKRSGLIDGLSHRGVAGVCCRSVFVCALAVLCLAGGEAAWAVVPGTTNPSQLTAEWSGFDWNSVYSWRSGSAVAIDEFWILSVRHVGGGVGNTLTANGLTHTVVQTVLGPTDTGQVKPTDLMLHRLDRPVSSYAPLYYGSLNPGTKAIIAGYGQTGQDYVTYYTMTGGAGIKRVGTNKVNGTDRVTTSAYSSQCLYMNFLSGDTPYEAGLGTGDSGGGTFVKEGGVWKLAGINAYVDTNGTAGQYDSSYAVSIPAYAMWTFTSLPQDNRWKGTTGSWATSTNWTNGAPTASQDLYVDNGGTARITGGTVSSGYVMVGMDNGGANTVEHTGGAHSLSGALYVGLRSGSNGTYSLGGTGSVSAGRVLIGMGGTGRFTQTGGTLNSSTDLLIGEYGGGTYEISGGTLTAKKLRVGDGSGSGLLDIGGAAPTITVTDTLRFGAGASLDAVTGSAIRVRGSAVQIATTDAAAMGGLANLTLSLEAGTSVWTTVEAAGRDLGLDPAGWVENFAIGSLVLGAGTGREGRLTLANAVDNTPGWDANEALYVDILQLNAGASIDLGGMSLYYRNGGDPKKLFFGDTTLDGAVDLDDLTLLGTFYGQVGGMTWAQGDFNGDLVVDLDDLTLLGTYYGMRGADAAPAGTLGADSDLLSTDPASTSLSSPRDHATPEPASAMLVLALLPLLRRRRG